MWAWLSMQVIAFETPQGDGWLMHHEEQALAWVAGAWPRPVDACWDPAEQTLDLEGPDVVLHLVGGEEWTGLLAWKGD